LGILYKKFEKKFRKFFLFFFQSSFFLMKKIRGFSDFYFYFIFSKGSEWGSFLSQEI